MMISADEYQARRQQLARLLPPDTLLILPAASLALRNGDAEYRFRQDSDFYYLTGFEEPNAILLLTSGAASRSILFCLPNDPLAEQWTGKRLGPEAAVRTLKVDEAYARSEFDHLLLTFMQDKYALYYPIGRYPRHEQQLLQAWTNVRSQHRRGHQAPEILGDIIPLISELRLFKSTQELALMRQAAAASVSAHQSAMQAGTSATFEYHLQAAFVYELTKQGCLSMAYEPIVAAGNHACTLHYTANNAPICDGDLVLIDAGGEYQNYAADITRTFPANGRFTAEQRDIYELVLAAQQAGLACVKPGCEWHQIQQRIISVLTSGLVDLKLLHGAVDDLIATEAYKPFYMHQSGHWLGLDVHDCGAYKQQGQWRSLQPGMVLTVEPGIYIDKHLPGIDERWLGIGVRIEDDVVVTAEGYDNLSGQLPVEISDIEALVRG